MEHFAGPVTDNQLILLGLSNSEIQLFQLQGMSNEDILEEIINNIQPF